MKVAMLGWEFPPFISGGLGIHCYELTRRLAEDGIEVDFYMPHMSSLQGKGRVADHHGHLTIKEIEADPAIEPYGGESRYDANFNAAVDLYNRRLVAAFDSPDADVLHCHDWITVPAALELKKRTGLPLVFTVHSTEYDRSGGFWPQAWIEDIERRGVHGADRLIAVSRYTKDLIVRLYGADPEKVHPVHNGIDATRFPGGDGRDYAAERGTVLFLSRLTPQKCPLQFLQAAKRVLEVRPETRFVVAGKGEMLPQCIDYTFRAGIEDNVRFTGFVPDDELPGFYSENELYVLPSFSEPFGISVLEAMATGLPTIVSRTSGVGEALQHVLKAEYWDTDEMADQIVALLSSPELRAEMGRNGAREAKRFTWATTSRRTIEVYQGLVSRPRLEPMLAV